MSSNIPYTSLPSTNYPNDAFENSPMVQNAVVEIAEARRMIPLDVAKGPLTTDDLNGASEDFEGIDMTRLERFAQPLKWLTAIAALAAILNWASTLSFMAWIVYLPIFFHVNLPILIGLTVWSVVSAVFALNLMKNPKRVKDIFWGAIPTICISVPAAVLGYFSCNLPVTILSLVLGVMQIPILIISHKAVRDDHGCCRC